MTKTTLLTATAIAAMAFAGAANAGQISGTINGQAFSGTAGAVTTYTIAKERNDAADTTGAGGAVLTNTLTNALTIAPGAGTQTFQVTFDITGGTIPAAATASMTAVQADAPGGGVGVPGAVSAVQTLRSTTSITFIVTVAAPTVDAVNVTGFTLTTELANSSAEANITAAASVSLLAGGVTTPVDTSAARTIVRYSNILSNLSATSNNTKAALPNFTLFTNTGVTTNPAPLSNAVTGGNRTAELASNFTAASATTGNAGGLFFGGLGSGAVSAADIVASGTLVIAGAFPTNSVAALTTGGTLTQTASSASFALDNTQVDALLTTPGTGDFLLTQPATAGDRAAIPAGGYIATLTPTLIAGYTASALSAANAGFITLDGTNFIAPWFSGSQAQSQSQIRLSNTAATAATVRLSITNGVFNFNGVPTNFGDTACATGAFTLPVNGDLVLSNAVMNACFGAFLRGDILISVEADSGGVTAKMRNTSSNGTFETTLGRYSGGVAADAAQ